MMSGTTDDLQAWWDAKVTAAGVAGSSPIARPSLLLKPQIRHVPEDRKHA